MKLSILGIIFFTFINTITYCDLNYNDYWENPEGWFICDFNSKYNKSKLIYLSRTVAHGKDK